MSIIWCGGEDIDFQAGISPGIDLVNGFRAGCARCSVHWGGGGGTWVKSTPFPGQSSFWLGFQLYPNSPFNTEASQRFLGILKSGTNSGLVLGSGTSGQL